MASIMRPSLLRQTPASTRSLLLRQNVGVSQAVNFHASARKQILPPLPQSIEGTMNDPAPLPKPSPVHGSYHWTFERAVCVGLVPLSIAPFAAGSLNPVMDAVLCSLLVVHSHIGFDASITDYFRPQRVPKTHALLKWLLRGFTLTTAVGLYEFETNDVGITEALRRIWTA
ncbi:Succinate dehydrogenase cytochrome b small subunit [Penicillium chermesinum]|uniref:Succinate dehydrogenase [ubiquinone] cytochrome b small subunit n=1 Tax=Penicillium chermesinum TaxID=63820 RepID=A0A9W9TKX4_9EURO|nr:Succinate dehydrogenase cytochrome b small subunit [Penicillium chermesinum]KAJ5226324.1 Succinate dehydrogenase cytochrome b small subunit [Penicillium chermesinum]